MKEDFIHYLWKTRRFPFTDLRTVSGASIQIKAWGKHNHHSGPDFHHADLSIDGQQWVGNVEMHVYSSDWTAHGHQHDPAYNSVILHVVWEDDAPIYTQSGKTIPTLELKHLVSQQSHVKYLRLRQSRVEIPCASYLSDLPSLVWSSWLDRLLVDRMEQKTAHIDGLLTETKGDWERSFFLHLSEYFGLQKNKLGFLMLARSLPLAVILKYRGDRLQLESLLYGQAGMLAGQMEGDYPQALAREYKYLRWKHQIEPMDASIWKFLRMRPAAFPTVRISLLAGLIEKSFPLLRTLTECYSLADLRSAISSSATEYWSTHYTFRRESKAQPKSITRGFQDLLLINAILPFLFHYYQRHQTTERASHVLQWLAEIKPELNKITKTWRELPVPFTSAADSQALLHLHQQYCTPKRCMDCAVGCHVMKDIYTVREEEAYYHTPI